MQADRNRYSYGGIAAMLKIIHFVVDRDQVPVVSEFLRDRERGIARIASLALQDVRNGTPKPYLLGY
jgi:hypothetical protein